MSAEEIRKIAESTIAIDRIHGQSMTDTVRGVMLTFAEMVERCEKKRADIMARTYRHDIDWMGGDDKVVYIALGDVLRGDAGKEER